MILADLSTDFDSIKQDISDDIKARGEIGKSLFPGEAGDILTDLGAAIFTMLSYRIEMAQRNSFMPTAFAKSSVYALASTLGASPSRKRGATMSATLTIVSTLSVNVAIPKYTRFSARDLTWYTRQEYLLTPATETIAITLYQGEPTIETFNGNGQEFQQFLLAEGSFTVEENVLEVLVNGSSWTRERNSLFEYGAEVDRNVFLEDTTPEGKVKLIFGNGVYGNVPVLSDILTVKYFVTEGTSSNSSIVGDTIDLLDAIDIGGSQDLQLTAISTSTSSSGADEDSVELLKFTSPRIFASNKRAVRRNDYEGFLRKYSGVLAGKVWGEFEEAFKLGYANNTMMNRVFFSAIKADIAKKTELIGTGTGATAIFNKTLTYGIVIPGSIIIDAGTIGWYDIVDYLVSDEVAFNEITGSGTSDSDSDNGSDIADYAFDQDEDTYWESDVAPTDLEPIHLTYDFGAMVTTTIASVRIQSSNDRTAQERAFPTLVSIYGSNVASPQIDDEDDWTVLRGNTELLDPGVRSWSKWLKMEGTTAYRYIRIKVLARSGDQNFVKIGNVQLQTIANSSTINYSTGAVHLKFASNVSNSQQINSTYLISDYTQDEINDIKEFFDDKKHMTTAMVYKSPIAIPQDIEIDVYYLENVINPNTLKTQVETAITNLLAINSDSFERDLKLSDIAFTVKNISGVDWVDIKTPSYNVIAQLREFIILNDLTVNIFRSQR